MVVISDKNSQSSVYFPKNFAPNSNILTLELKSTVRNDIFSFDVSDESGLTDFFVFEADFSDIPDGEYKYIVKETDENVINSTGLVKIGDWKPENEQYAINQEYTQYEYE